MRLPIKWKQVLLVFALLLLSRLILFGISYYSSGTLGVVAWTHWDGGWYFSIMERGYDNSLPEVPPNDALCQQGLGICQRNVAFFPLYPILGRTVADLFRMDSRYGALIVSNLSFFAAGLLLFRLTKKIFKDKGVAWSAVFLFAFYPFSYIFSGVMTEGLFIFLLLAGYSLALEKKYLAAGLVGILLSASRNTGVLFAIPLFLVWLESKNHVTLRNIFSKLWHSKGLILALCLVPLGLVAFMLYLNNHVGDALAFVNIQQYWEKPVLGLNPIFAFFFSFIDRRVEGPWIIHLMNLSVVSMVFGLFVYSVKTKVLKLSLNNFFLWIVVPMSAGTLLAMGRYSAVIFPIYLVLGYIVNKYKLMRWLVFTVFIIGFLVLGWFYYRGAWVAV